MNSDRAQSALTGLILTGGGARAAYQVGVLQEIASMRKAAGLDLGNLYQVISGTSAGAINASMLACAADRFDDALDNLSQIWREFKVEQVYRSDVLDMIRSGARWMTLLSLGWLFSQKRLRPKSLLDNAPLGRLLHEHIDFDRLPALLAEGHLHALAVSASNYSNGEHVTFYNSKSKIEPWVRNQRVAMQCELKHEHLLASSGIPFVFPAACLQGPQGMAWYGDGAMRQTAPISPAIHLGAEKILVIGAGRMNEPEGQIQQESPTYPSMANIAGHALSSIFLDALAVDVERLQRVNNTIRLIPEDKRVQSKLKSIELLVISPSERLDLLAIQHASALPSTVQNLLRTLGAQSKGHLGQGGALISYLLFESAYTQELMALGQKDARLKAQEIHDFFGWRQGAD
jgi:NTE family protein